MLLEFDDWSFYLESPAAVTVFSPVFEGSWRSGSPVAPPPDDQTDLPPLLISRRVSITSEGWRTAHI